MFIYIFTNILKISLPKKPIVYTPKVLRFASSRFRSEKSPCRASASVIQVTSYPELPAQNHRQAMIWFTSRIMEARKQHLTFHPLGIQSCQMMIGVYTHLLSTVFKFHNHSQKVIGSPGSGCWLNHPFWNICSQVKFIGSWIPPWFFPGWKKK